jgi:nitroreductase
MNDPQPFLELMAARHCQRAFLNEPVPRTVLESVLTAARNAPSGKNTQPWSVEVMEGKTLAELAQKLCELFDANTPMSLDYDYHPKTQLPEHIERARDCGYSIFAHKGIERHDRAARREHSRQNFLFFNAPLACIFHLPKPAESGNFLDLGMFMQNVMLGLVAHGLGSCPQASVAGYPDAIRECLGLAEDRLIVAGLAIGRPDPSATVNTFIPTRLPLAEYAKWHD